LAAVFRAVFRGTPILPAAARLLGGAFHGRLELPRHVLEQVTAADGDHLRADGLLKAVRHQVER